MELKASGTPTSEQGWLSKLCRQLGECQTVDDVHQVLGGLDPSLLSDDRVESVLTKLHATSRPERLMELVLSSGSWSKPLSTWFSESITKSPERLANNIQGRVIERLSHFLYFFQHPRGEHLDPKAFVRANTIPRVLPVLLSMTFNESSTATNEVLDEFEGLSFLVKVKQARKNQPPKGPKGTRHQGPSEQDLAKLEIPMPESREQALATAKLLMEMLQADLKGYLTSLQDKEVIPIIQAMFVEASLKSASTTDGTYPSRTEIHHAAPGGQVEASSEVLLAQPTMKASLYFENARGLGAWRIMLSGRAEKYLRTIEKGDPECTLKAVFTKIVELSNGDFCYDNQKYLNNKGNHNLPIYEAKLPGDRRLVYRIDCVPDYHSETERQVIKIFGIYRHQEIKKQLWATVGNQLAGKGMEYRRRCTFRNRPLQSDKSILPASFPPLDEDTIQDAIPVPELPKEDLEELHSLLGLEKFVTLSKELLTSIWADLDAAHVFDVTRQEKEIIEHPHSCYVLGRSGTGKTTTMLFKMLGIERAYSQQVGLTDVAKPRQLFVTQSRVLATRVEEYFSKLLESMSAAQKSRDELNYIAGRRKLLQKETGLYDREDDIVWKAGLPEKFSLLQDHHFPLFLTFNQLLYLLEGDVAPSRQDTSVWSEKESDPISYDTFLVKYWPHFSQELTKSFDPALVYGEMLGVIEGSEQSLSHETRHLSRESYSKLSHRAQHTFAKQRDKVYSLFKAYVKQKQQHSDFDTADRTHRILKAFETEGVPGSKIDYLYVDEAQDNLIIDAMLLRSICRNPNGLFWAGDTAQTIAIGSSFRFNDLKAFLYRLEQRRMQKSIDGSGITQSELRTFQLVVNYRSHNGIVRCATTAIDLISQFWPYAIDSLAPERGIVDGAKPVFFTGWGTDTIAYDQFLFGDSGERIEFGARQCILVRDETARNELRQRVGDIGVILTLYDSKGLEFDDVLLYKFFEDSKVDVSQWRIVLNMLKTSSPTALPAPRFEEERHAGVCSELKFLYVAITRSRKNLWIIDSSEKAEPMRLLWESKGFIEICRPGGDIPRIAVRSAPEEWADTGHAFFNKRQYMQAANAFDRAELARESAIARAHQLREDAKQIQPVNPERVRVRRETFRAAAISFLECAKGGKGDERRVLFHNAGYCYEHAGGGLEDHGNAAEAYISATEYPNAIKVYQRGEMYLEATNVVRKYRQKLPAGLAEATFEVARLFYFMNKDFRKAKALFDSVEEQLDYLEDNILLDECHASVLVELGSYQLAAEVHAREGRTMEAIRVLLLDERNAGSIAMANDYILQGLWQHTSFSQKIKDTDTKALAFLELASGMDRSLLSPTQRDELAIFENLNLMIAASDTSAFRRLAYGFLKRNQKHEALLCFDHQFTNFPSLVNATNVDLVAILEDFSKYVSVFKDIILTLDISSPHIQRLFNFTRAPMENAYSLMPGTWIYQQAAKARPMKGGECIIAGYDLHLVLTQELWHRLQARLADEDSKCRSAAAFSPCISSILNVKGCHKASYCLGYHTHPKDLTQDWFYRQLKIHALQILICHVYHSIPLLKDTLHERRHWIHKLFETMWPSTHMLGFQATTSIDSVPEAQQAFVIVKRWSNDILNTRNVAQDSALLTFLYEAGFLSLFIDREHAESYLSGAPLLGAFDSERSPGYFRTLANSQDKIYILPELFQSLQAKDKAFVSAGILFLKRVVDTKEIQIDVNVLCHLVDYLSGSLILARRDFNLHDVTLPRGWLLLLLQHISAAHADTPLVDLLLDSLEVLLETLIQGKDAARYLIFEGAHLAHNPSIRYLFISRICRAIGLIGYNLNYVDLRKKIVRIMKVLGTTTVHHPTFKRFIGRRFWGGIKQAVEASVSDSYLDNLVLCWDSQIVQENSPTPGVQVVSFRTRDDVITGLSSGPLSIHGSIDTDAIVPDETEHEQLDEEAAEPHDTAPVNLADSQEIAESLVSTATPLVVDFISDEKYAAASKIAIFYERVLQSRRLSASKSTAQKSYDSLCESCMRSSVKIDSPPRSLYRALYLGMLPHILVCLNGLQIFAYAEKVKAKAAMTSARGQVLENLGRKRTEIGNILKSSKLLFAQLEPNSEWHKQRDTETLRKLVGEVEAMVKQVPSVAADVSFHLDLAVNAVKQKNEQKKRARKPKLNTDDLYEYDYATYSSPHRGSASLSHLPFV
ncbi:hypothetical protein DFP72DRAFT_865039 [Ephemerocybe angulata]|uniref:UvrD-like helicase ATP-binding domain-containing protein n=1 Tax=Ephemerocybe angulata TaxID=980116 RepID=A0A8H6II66_9AGAR|nr:hypothetical protein DFP72DRAFT_865039 [Tulosesus angulatus]